MGFINNKTRWINIKKFTRISHYLLSDDRIFQIYIGKIRKHVPAQGCFPRLSRSGNGNHRIKFNQTMNFSFYLSINQFHITKLDRFAVQLQICPKIILLSETTKY